MSECKPTNTPGYGPELSNQQSQDNPLVEGEKKRYQGIVRCLMYVSHVCEGTTSCMPLVTWLAR